MCRKKMATSSRARVRAAICHQPRTSSRSTSASASDSYSMTRQDLFGANDMRGLDADSCLFIGNIGSEAADEVLRVQPLYVAVNV